MKEKKNSIMKKNIEEKSLLKAFVAVRKEKNINNTRNL